MKKAIRLMRIEKAIGERGKKKPKVEENNISSAGYNTIPQGSIKILFPQGSGVNYSQLQNKAGGGTTGTGSRSMRTSAGQMDLGLEESQIDIQTLLLRQNPTRKLAQFYKSPKERLGEGGFGTVRKVVHKESGQLRAVKILKLNPETIDLLSTELSVLLQLDHPNVLKCYEWFDWPRSGLIEGI
jgi:hypothetical protein